ncbi:bifunctional proline dehydrogenase/L-glutamate gamma-semialdehyde dehydrogenase [Gulosibacter macacae]|nr:bifunctional proline dehydrogenase/L-glutamate gamma-semialdehyde dehydrogenase [Gulosibacter macacae]
MSNGASDFHDLAPRAVDTVREWLAEAERIPVDPAGEQLARLLRDPNGLSFAVGFVDGVIRPEDPEVAAANLQRLTAETPGFLPAPLRAAAGVGGTLAPRIPGIVVPIARRVLRQLVGHLILDASDVRLGPALRKLNRDGNKLNLNLLGEAVLGDREATRRLERTTKLLRRPDVDYVSIKVSATTAPHQPWGFADAVTETVDRLLPLFSYAAAAKTPKFINLDMEEYRDLEFTIAVFMRLLSQPALKQLEAGLVLQTYLPNALGAMQRLQAWASSRVNAGGAPIKVRLVKGANLPMERVDAEVHGWPLATYHAKVDTDANYKRVLDWALTPEHTANVRLGIAGHNLFDVALAWLVAERRGVTAAIEFEMLLGMATQQAEVVRRHVGGLRLYTPIVHPGEFDVAIAYLVRRLEEGAASDNFMSAVFELADNERLFARERDCFLTSIEEMAAATPNSHRAQDRTRPASPALRYGFENAPDSDPAMIANQAWAEVIREHIATSQLGEGTRAANTVATSEELDARIQAALDSGWGAWSADERADALHAVGDELERRRAELIEVAAAECGKTLDQADVEVSEAVDFAHYYAERARELERIDGARFSPAKLIAVTPPWNFPLAIPAGSTLAALAAGAPAILKPASAASRCGALLAEAIWQAVPREAMQYVQFAERELGSKLIADEAVERVILTGGYETAEAFRSIRPEVELLAETSGKNAIIITPSADYDLAVRDVIASAFGHAGQKCSAASLVILVGQAGASKRLRDQLVDGVRSLRVGPPSDALAKMGPIIAPASGKLLRGLSVLGEGENWVLEPRPLDKAGILWSPGLRAGVRRGSEYHLTEYFGPILGVMRVDTLDEAIEAVNEVDYGLTSGLHSRDAEEIARWLERVQAGNLYVNRGITGAIVQRQPFGGWKKSVVGATVKAGGPNYLFGLGNWDAAEAVDGATPVEPRVVALLDAVGDDLARGEDRALRPTKRETGASSASAHGLDGALRFSKGEVGGASSASARGGGHLARAAASDEAAWQTEFSQNRDVQGLAAERNVFRYLPVTAPVQLRVAEGEPIEHALRLALAGLRAGAPFVLSTAEALPPEAMRILHTSQLPCVIETDAEFRIRVPKLRGRLRFIGSDAEYRAVAAASGSPELAIWRRRVTESGRLELLPFLHEQAVSITAHRYGSPDPLVAEVLA